jgi:hypothetical protein
MHEPIFRAWFRAWFEEAKVDLSPMIVAINPAHRSWQTFSRAANAKSDFRLLLDRGKSLSFSAVALYGDTMLIWLIVVRA